MFFISKPITVLTEPFFAFGDGDVVVVVAGGFYIKEVHSFACLYFLRINLFSAVAFVIFHRTIV